MDGYGQFCSVARAVELLGPRWSLLVVRELLCGATRFNDIQRGIPRISKTMLSQRLRELVDGGVIARSEDEQGPVYGLTPAGAELAKVVRELGVWGQRWLPRQLGPDQLDEDALLWDVQRRIEVDALPDAAVVVRFELTDLPVARRRRYLLLRRAEVSLCTSNPGFPEAVVVYSDRRTLTAWWRGDLDYRAARRAGLRVDGKRRMVSAFPTWFKRYLFAGVAPAA